MPHNDPTSSPLTFERRIIELKRRLEHEAKQALAMLESALASLWNLDREGAKLVRAADDSVDREEVAIERESFEILTLQHVFARDFRMVTFIIKVNADIERMADHASSVAKITSRISKQLPPGVIPRWPTCLRELGDRVTIACHNTLRALVNEDVDAAKEVAASDQLIDELERRLFDESIELMKAEGKTETAMAVGLLVSRVGRELERIGDLMKNIAEDLIYLSTGDIVRHAEKPARFANGVQIPPGIQS